MSLNQLSEKTIYMMDKAMKNLADGKVSEPVDIDEIRKIADELPD